MEEKIKKVLALIPDVVCITLTVSDFNQYKLQVSSNDVSCECTELRYKNVVIKKQAA